MKLTILIIIVVLVNISCQKKLDVPDTGRKIVINGLITTDSLLNVQISRSFYLNYNTGDPGNLLYDLDNVAVKILKNNLPSDSLYHMPFYYYDNWMVFNGGNYKSKSTYPQAENKYTIIATSNNLPVAMATTTIPKVVKIVKVDTVGIILAVGSFVNLNKGFLCKIEFNDPIEETNYYLFNIREMMSENYASPNNSLDFSCDDPIVEEKLFDGEKNEGLAFSDKLFNGQNHILNVIIKKEMIGNYTAFDAQTVCFRLYSITEEYFQYIKDLNLYSKNYGNPLADPVMVYSNVSGGYGMFSGAAISSYSVIFEKK
jgi:hypothetical protein